MKSVLRSTSVVILCLVFGLTSSGMSAVAQDAPPVVRWQHALSDGAAYGLGLSDDGATLIAVIGFGFDPGGEIVSLDPETGAVLWTMATSEGASADPIVVDGAVYAGMGSLTGGGAAVYALDAVTGEMRWRTDVGNPDLPATPVDAIVFADGKLYVNRGDAALLKLDAVTGDVEWELDLRKPSRGAPFVAGETVYVSTGFDGARMFAFDATTGEERWAVEDADNPVTGPVLAEGLLYVTFTDGEVAAFDPATGEERWRAYAGVLDEEVGIDPSPGLPLVVDGTLFVSSNGFAGAHTVALDAQTGRELWKTPTGDFSASAPALLDNVLLVGSDSGDLLALDPATGAELWRVAIPNQIEIDLDQSSPALVSGAMIFARDKLGGVVALGTGSLRDSLAANSND